MTSVSEPAPAKVNLALHVRRRLADGRHGIETLFAFCTDGDRVSAERDELLSLRVIGPMASGLEDSGDNLVLRAAEALRESCGSGEGALLTLEKNLPVASGVGGGSADAAATLRLLTRLWNIDPSHASAVAPTLGADVPACLLSMTARGEAAGDDLSLVKDDRITGAAILLVNPAVPLSTRDVFAGWDGVDRGPLGDWRDGRNDLEPSAAALVPEIREVLRWLETRHGTNFVRMSGSGATCFALFDEDRARDEAAAACPRPWWHLATNLR